MSPEVTPQVKEMGMEVLMETEIAPEPEDLQEQQGKQVGLPQLELELDQVMHISD